MARGNSTEPPVMRALLFGRTGAGKSTVANVLATGGIENVIFPFSDAAIGCTSEIQKGSGRGWTVTDTVGLGEAQTGNVSNAEAQEKLTEFLKKVNEKFSHIIYVQKQGRIDTLDELIWGIFTSIFMGAEPAFVILFTGAEEAWLEQNRSKLPSYLKSQKNILVTDIPPVHRRPTMEKRNEKKREKAISKLDAELIEIFRQNDNQFFTPHIANMSEEELKEKSFSILQFIIDQIKRLYREADFESVARKLGSLFDVVSFIMEVVSTVQQF